MPSVTEIKTLIQDTVAAIRFAHTLTPLNLATEREAFFTSHTSSPQLVYPEVNKLELESFLKKLEAVELTADSTTETFAETLAQKRLAELKLQIRLLQVLDSPQITAASTSLYDGQFSPADQKQAEIDASSPLKFGARENLTADETVIALQDYLASEYDQTDWQISVSDQGDFYVRVKASRRQILVNRRINWDFSDLESMLAHEIDGHVLRFLNAQHQENPEFRSSLPFYIKTEEGLASFLGDYCTPHGELALKQHALKYLAGIQATASSFREVYTFLMDHGFTSDLAFQRTMRLKRGLSDTAQAGCFAKEALYYEGLQEVKSFIDNGGNVHQLFAAKAGLPDIAIVPVPSEIVIPHRVLKYLAQTQP